MIGAQIYLLTSILWVSLLERRPVHLMDTSRPIHILFRQWTCQWKTIDREFIFFNAFTVLGYQYGGAEHYIYT